MQVWVTTSALSDEGFEAFQSKLERMGIDTVVCDQDWNGMTIAMTYTDGAYERLYGPFYGEAKVSFDPPFGW